MITFNRFFPVSKKKKNLSKPVTDVLFMIFITLTTGRIQLLLWLKSVIPNSFWNTNTLSLAPTLESFWTYFWTYLKGLFPLMSDLIRKPLRKWEFGKCSMYLIPEAGSKSRLVRWNDKNQKENVGRGKNISMLMKNVKSKTHPYWWKSLP